MGIAERPLAADGAVGQFAGQRTHQGNLQRLARVQRRKQAGQALRQHRFARAGRPDHQQIVAAGGGDLQRALGALLAFHIPQIGHRARQRRQLG